MVNARFATMSSHRCARTKGESSSHSSLRTASLKSNGDALEETPDFVDILVFRRVCLVFFYLLLALTCIDFDHYYVRSTSRRHHTNVTFGLFFTRWKL